MVTSSRPRTTLGTTRAMPVTSANPPSSADVQRVAGNALQSKSVRVEKLDGYLYRTYYLTTSSRGFFYILRCRPNRTIRLLRHEQDRLDDEACTLQALSGWPDVLLSTRLIEYQTTNTTIGSKYLISGPFSGSIFANVESSMSRQALANVDRSLGQFIRRLSAVTGPTFGPIRKATSFGSASWTRTFTLMLESVLRDGEDALINLPYDGIRDLARMHRPSVDRITQPRLVILEVSADDNIIVDAREHRVTGLLDYSTAMWGDPFISNCFVRPTTSFIDGFGKIPNGDSDERIRQYLYVLYHSLLTVVRHYYRPSADTNELEARRDMTTAMQQLLAMAAR